MSRNFYRSEARAIAAARFLNSEETRDDYEWRAHEVVENSGVWCVLDHYVGDDIANTRIRIRKLRGR